MGGVNRQGLDTEPDRDSAEECHADFLGTISQQRMLFDRALDFGDIDKLHSMEATTSN
jgi:hypothetical protein